MNDASDVQLAIKVLDKRVELATIKLVKKDAQTHVTDHETEIAKMEKELLQTVIKNGVLIDKRIQLKKRMSVRSDDYQVRLDNEKQIFDHGMDIASGSSSQLQFKVINLDEEVESDPLKPFACEEVGCFRHFRQKYVMKTHFLRIHKKHRPFICPKSDCTASYAISKDLTAHLVNTHGKRTFSCQHHGCNKSFTTSGKLKRHQESHSNVKPFLCLIEDCGKKFKTSLCLRQHSRVHAIERPFTCEWVGCGRSFVLAFELNYHQRRHGYKTIECGDCERRFFTSSELGSHKRRHHSNVRPFKCDWGDCEKRFVTKEDMSKHHRTHTGEKPCVCDDRGKRFTQHGHLRDHERARHSGLKPYACSKCSKTFALSQDRNRHAKSCVSSNVHNL